MCPPGYHHNGIMAARELGHTMYGLYIYIYIYIFNSCLDHSFVVALQHHMLVSKGFPLSSGRERETFRNLKREANLSKQACSATTKL